MSESACVKSVLHIPPGVKSREGSVKDAVNDRSSYRMKNVNKYRSPDPSPINMKTTNEQGKKCKDAVKENIDFSTLVARSNSKNAPAPGHRPLESINSNQNNIKDLENYIEKYHPALAQKNSESSKQQIEKLIHNNKSLSELIKLQEVEISQRIQEETSRMTKTIQKVQSEIDVLETNVELQKLSSKKSECTELTQLALENRKLNENLENLQEKVRLFKLQGIKQEEFFVVQEKIISLESVQETLFIKNAQLKKELQNQITSNSASKSCVEMHSNIEKLTNIYSLIYKFQKLGKKYINKEEINLTDLLSYDGLVVEKSIPGLISLIRKEIGSLRVLVSDIYAENCGSTCQNQ